MSSFGDFIALSDVCDKATALLIKKEVSDGVIAPGYTDEALEILKAKKKGNYNIIKIDENYKPAEIERKQVFGVTFEQGRNELDINDELLGNIVTNNKELSDEAKRDLKIALITLKYTQSNSVCYVKDGQAIGIGAGQQSRIHCTRLAGNKADIWWLRQAPKVLGLQFVDGIKRADRDNAIDVYISDEYMDVLADGVWEKTFKVKPEVFTKEEQRAWLDKNTDVALGSDAFFPFGDNIERAKKSGVTVIAQPGGSIRDDNVIETCNKYNMCMSFTGIRLFHHYPKDGIISSICTSKQWGGTRRTAPIAISAHLKLILRLLLIGIFCIQRLVAVPTYGTAHRFKRTAHNSAILIGEYFN